MEIGSGQKNNFRKRCTRVAEAVIGVLNKADLNPHEGRLRGSVMPAEYIDVPDFPPMHDGTIVDTPPAEPK